MNNQVIVFMMISQIHLTYFFAGVSHCYDPDPTKNVQCLLDNTKALISFMTYIMTANLQVRSLSETVRLDASAKHLNPKS